MNQSWLGHRDGSPLVILRNHRRTTDEAEILDEHILLQNLQQQTGELIAAPLCARTGETRVHSNGQSFALFPFRHGETMKREEPRCIRLAAGTLATLHLALLQISVDPLTHGRRPPLIERSFELQCPLNPSQQAETEFTIQTARRFSSALKNLPTEPAPLCPIHGDYGPRNILWDPVTETTTAVLDWEEWRLDHPLYDVVAATASFTDAGIGHPAAEFPQHYLAALKECSPDLGATFAESLTAHWKNIAARIWFHELQLCMKGSFGDEFPIHYIARLVKLIREALS